MPYIRDNLFRGQRAAVRMVAGDEQPIVRNNLFLDCKDAGIALSAKGPTIFGPSIRNCIFSRCGAAVTGNAELLKNCSHCLLHQTKSETLKAGQASNTDGDPGISVDAAGVVTVAHSALLEGKGIKAGGDPEGHAPWIGLEQPWWHTGVGATEELPPTRFQPPGLIANAVKEEYQYLQARGLSMGEQSTGKDKGKHYDALHCSEHGKPLELRFDISRFYDESSIQP